MTDYILNLLFERQFSFRDGNAMEVPQLKLLINGQSHLIKICTFLAIFTDYSEAFSNVNHTVLLKHLYYSLREKCPYSELLWSVFSQIRTRITPNTDTFYALTMMQKTKILNGFILTFFIENSQVFDKVLFLVYVSHLFKMQHLFSRIMLAEESSLFLAIQNIIAWFIS